MYIPLAEAEANYRRQLAEQEGYILSPAVILIIGALIGTYINRHPVEDHSSQIHFTVKTLDLKRNDSLPTGWVAWLDNDRLLVDVLKRVDKANGKFHWTNQLFIWNLYSGDFDLYREYGGWPCYADGKISYLSIGAHQKFVEGKFGEEQETVAKEKNTGFDQKQLRSPFSCDIFYENEIPNPPAQFDNINKQALKSNVGAVIYGTGTNDICNSKHVWLNRDNDKKLVETDIPSDVFYDIGYSEYANAYIFHHAPGALCEMRKMHDGGNYEPGPFVPSKKKSYIYLMDAKGDVRKEEFPGKVTIPYYPVSLTAKGVVQWDFDSARLDKEKTKLFAIYLYSHGVRTKLFSSPGGATEGGWLKTFVSADGCKVAAGIIENESMFSSKIKVADLCTPE